MQLAKESYLDISFTHREGLVLNWNFQHLLKHTVYFHHLFVLMTPNTEKTALLLEKHYKRIKQGDLMAFIYLNRKGKQKRTSWVEKTPIDPSPVPRLLRYLSD